MRSGWHLGIDIGGTSVRLLGEGPDGVRGELVSAATPGSYDEFLELIALMAPRAAAGPLAAVGCGLPGKSEGAYARFVPALPWLENRPVAEDLARLLGAGATPLLALDAHLALLAEAAEGAARGRSSAVLVAVGTGIGGAVMVDGRIWRGRHGCAGSWGWLPALGAVDDDRHGPFEQVASGTALGSQAEKLTPPCSSRELVGRARDGDATARAEVERYARRLGRGLAAIASVIDAEVVLVGGGLSSAMDVLAPTLDECVRAYASPDGRLVPIVPAELGPAAGVVGAVAYARRGEEALR